MDMPSNTPSEELTLIVDPIDPLDNPVGAVMQVFFEGRMPDGNPLPDESRTALGGSLIDFLMSDRDFRTRMGLTPEPQAPVILPDNTKIEVE